MVGATGFEPATTCTPSKCATRLRYAPLSRLVAAGFGVSEMCCLMPAPSPRAKKQISRSSKKSLGLGLPAARGRSQGPDVLQFLVELLGIQPRGLGGVGGGILGGVQLGVVLRNLLAVEGRLEHRARPEG